MSPSHNDVSSSVRNKNKPNSTGLIEYTCEHKDYNIKYHLKCAILSKFLSKQTINNKKIATIYDGKIFYFNVQKKCIGFLLRKIKHKLDYNIHALT